MKVGVLTSSRADYGIYFPLLQKMKEDPFFAMEIIAFGMHLEKRFGYTVESVKKNKYQKVHEIPSFVEGDSEASIAESYGKTVLAFAKFWNLQKYDWVLCLGDRFEMSAAVQAGIPFRVKFAHLHGGETTLGATDNIYRHQITIASKLHFTSTAKHTDLVKKIVCDNSPVFTVGSLSLDGIENFAPMDRKSFGERFGVPDGDFILATFHPETVVPGINHSIIPEIKKALTTIAQMNHIVVTMPNADVLGMAYREMLKSLKSEFPDRFTIIENFGKEGYFSSMMHAKVLLGNSSSGVIEAASFGKWAVNTGDRQKGRAQSGNVLNCENDAGEIVDTTIRAMAMGDYEGVNIYFQRNVSESIIDILKATNEAL